MPSCEKCPCPSACLRWPIFCEWAAEEPPDPVKLAHICARSAMPPATVPTAVPGDRPTVAESMSLIAGMKACPYRSPNPGCGCAGGGKCALRGGATATHRDCFECITTYGA